MSRYWITPSGVMDSGSIHPTQAPFSWGATEKATNSSRHCLDLSRLRRLTNQCHWPFGCLVGKKPSMSRHGFPEPFNG